MTDPTEDALYLNLKGARERLCRAEVMLGADEAKRRLLDEAIARIDSVGAFLPLWSKYDLPTTADPFEEPS